MDLFCNLLNCLNFTENSVEWSKSVLNLRCRVCRRKGDAETMLLCDGCNRGYHSTCLKPAIEVIPKGDWYCYDCRPEEPPPKPRDKKRRLADEEDIIDELDRSDSDEDVGRRTGRRGGGRDRHSNENSEEEEVCVECSVGGEELIKCEECSDSYHLLCLNPPLGRAPRGAWTCYDCKSAATKGKGSSSNSTKKKAKVTSKWIIESDEEEDDEEDEDTGRSDAGDLAEDSRNGRESGQ